jgi:hypothetical protein
MQQTVEIIKAETERCVVATKRLSVLDFLI